MSDFPLNPGDAVIVYKKGKKKYKKTVSANVIEVRDKFIFIATENYKETISIFDLRNGEVALTRPDGSRINFKPNLDYKKIIKIQDLNKVNTRYKESEANNMNICGLNVNVEEVKKICSENLASIALQKIASKYSISLIDVQKIIKKLNIKLIFDPEEIKEAKINIPDEEQPKPEEKPKLRKGAVLEMYDSGKSIDEITEFFKDSWNGKISLLTAKITLFINSPSKKHNSEKKEGKKAKGISPEEVKSQESLPEVEKANKIENRTVAEPFPSKAMSLLKPKVLSGKEVQYSINPEDITILDITGNLPDNELQIEISKEYLPLFIKELQEIEKIIEEVS